MNNSVNISTLLDRYWNTFTIWKVFGSILDITLIFFLDSRLVLHALCTYVAHDVIRFSGDGAIVVLQLPKNNLVCNIIKE